VDDRVSHRVYFIDWLRILGVLLLIPYHTLRVFNPAPFYVKASTLSSAIDGVLSFLKVWHMPLLFFLAGCSTYFALHKRTGGRYAWERAKRLLVPFVFGFFVLMPPVTWYAARQGLGYTESYWQYLLSGDFLDWNISFAWGHLWFILFLFVFSLVALPLIVWGARGRGVGRLQSFSRRLSRPVWWLLPMVILFIGAEVPDIAYRPAVLYFFVFLFGFVALCDPRFVESAERHRWLASIGGLALTLCWVILDGYFRESLYVLPLDGPDLVFLNVAACWLMLMGAMGLGKRYLDRTSPAQKYLAQASYPVYILQTTVIVIIAFYVVQLAIPVPAQWVVLMVLAVAGIFVLYEVVRRVGVLRFLFGMKPRRRTHQPPEPGQ
jgi:glucan biosynthesis protein C